MTTARPGIPAALARLALLVAAACPPPLAGQAVGAADLHADPHAGRGRILETTRGPAVPAGQGYLVEEIRDGLYWLTDGHYQSLFLTTGAGVIVVDAPRSLAPKLLEAIASVTSEPVTHLVYSHSHADHVAAAGVLPKGITIVGHVLTKRFLEQAKDPARPLPTITFQDDYALEVGSQRLDLHWPGPNHDADNILIHVPRQKVVMMVDVAWPGWVHFHGFGVGDHLPGVLAATEAILGYDFEVFVGGHASRYGNRADVELSRDYFVDVRNAAVQAYESVDFGRHLRAAGWEHRWDMFDGYFRELTDACAAQVVPKWEARLGGAKAFTPPNCLRMALGLWMD